MANSVVGNLIVQLTAHTAEFDSNLKKAGDTAKGFANDVGTHTEAAGGKLESLGKRIASRLFGGGNVRLASAFEGAASSLTGISAVGLGTIGVLTGLGIIAKRFGDELRADEKEAKQLGITLAEYQAKTGKTQFSEGAMLGAKAVSSAWETAWNFSARITKEVSGWAMLPFFGWLNNSPKEQAGLDAAERRKIRDQGQIATKDKPGISGFNDFMKGLEQQGKDMGLSDLEKQMAAINNKWLDLNDLQKQNAKHQLQANQWKKEALELDARIVQIGVVMNKQAMDRAGYGAQEIALVNRKGFDRTSAEGKRELDAARGADVQARMYAEDDRLRTESEKLADRVRSLADSLTIRDPLVEFRNQIEQLNAGLQSGAINQAQYAGAIAGLRSKTVADMSKDLTPAKASGFYEVGTLQAYQQQIDSEMNAETKRQTALLESQLKQEEESLTVQREIRDNIKPPGVAVL